LSDAFPVLNGMKYETWRCFVGIAFQLCFRIDYEENRGKLEVAGTEWGHISFLCTVIMLIYKQLNTKYIVCLVVRILDKSIIHKSFKNVTGRR